MCLNPRNMLNKRYLPTKKNGGVPELCWTELAKYIEVPCGYCSECRKKKANDWTLRLNEEHRMNGSSALLTFTISEEAMSELIDSCNSTDARKIALVATRRWRERYRKKTGKSPKHWFAIEIGENGTERVHLHGFVYGEAAKDIEGIVKCWGYGNVHEGYSSGPRANRYACKYIIKAPKPMILTSPGIGRDWIKTSEAKTFYKFRGSDTEQLKEIDGFRYGLPQYWRAKLWNDDQRMSLWMWHAVDFRKVVDGREYRLEGMDGVSNSLDLLPIANPEIERNWLLAREEAQRRDRELGFTPVKPLGREARRIEPVISAFEKTHRELLRQEAITYEFEPSITHSKGGLWRCKVDSRKKAMINAVGSTLNTKDLAKISGKEFIEEVQRRKNWLILAAARRRKIANVGEFQNTEPKLL